MALPLVDYRNGHRNSNLDHIHIQRINAYVQTETAVIHRKTVCRVCRRVLRQKHRRDSSLEQRNPGIAQALFRSGTIEQYGTDIPRIKRDYDATVVKFGYSQPVSPRHRNLELRYRPS